MTTTTKTGLRKGLEIAPFLPFFEIQFSYIAIYEKEDGIISKIVLTNFDSRITIKTQKHFWRLQYMETKRDKFVRIVENRTNKIIDMLRLLGNCANKANYDYTEADVNKIFNTLEKELRAAKMKYLASGSEEEKFKL